MPLDAWRVVVESWASRQAVHAGRHEQRFVPERIVRLRKLPQHLPDEIGLGCDDFHEHLNSSIWATIARFRWKAFTSETAYTISF